MWLDRLAGHQSGSATPQSNSRPISPLPRRTSSARGPGPYLTSQASPLRPGVTPRGSSLSLISNDSTSSFLASSRRPNGSTLKQSTAVAEGPEPEEVLETLLGAKANGVAPEEPHKVTITQDDLDFDFDFDGLSLRDLAQDYIVVDGDNVYRPQTVEECTSCIRLDTPWPPFRPLLLSLRFAASQMSVIKPNLKNYTGLYEPATTY